MPSEAPQKTQTTPTDTTETETSLSPEPQPKPKEPTVAPATYADLQGVVLVLSFATAIGWGLVIALVLCRISDRWFA